MATGLIDRELKRSGDPGKDNDRQGTRSLAAATVDFSGGQNLPFVTEGLDALPDAATVATLQKRIAAANTTCTSVKVTLPGAGTSTMTVRAVSAPRGRNPPHRRPRHRRPRRH